jgi:hypothetical protein
MGIKEPVCQFTHGYQEKISSTWQIHANKIGVAWEFIVIQ